MRARIDVSEVEARTKIRAKYLRAIENEEWDLLPGSVYAKSFLRTYGDFLGLDSRSLIEEYKRRYEGPTDHDVVPATSLRRERERRQRRSRLPSWAPIGAVVVVVLVLLFVVGIASQPGSSTTSGHTTVGRHTTPATPSQTTTKAATPPTPTPATLALVPTGTVYVCLVNGAGKKLINEQTFAAGQTIPTARGHKLLLTLGNASVTMKANGTPYTVAPSPSAIRLEITRSGVTHIPFATTPTCP